jgi:hypothetical protein
MPRRLWLSLGALAIGVGLLATAQLAGAAHRSRQGGIFRVVFSGAITIRRGFRFSDGAPVTAKSSSR